MPGIVYLMTYSRVILSNFSCFMLAPDVRKKRTLAVGLVRAALQLRTHSADTGRQKEDDTESNSCIPLPSLGFVPPTTRGGPNLTKKS